MNTAAVSAAEKAAVLEGSGDRRRSSPREQVRKVAVTTRPNAVMQGAMAYFDLLKAISTLPEQPVPDQTKDADGSLDLDFDFRGARELVEHAMQQNSDPARRQGFIDALTVDITEAVFGFSYLPSTLDPRNHALKALTSLHGAAYAAAAAAGPDSVNDAHAPAPAIGGVSAPSIPNFEAEKEVVRLQERVRQLENAINEISVSAADTCSVISSMAKMSCAYMKTPDAYRFPCTLFDAFSTIWSRAEMTAGDIDSVVEDCGLSDPHSLDTLRALHDAARAARSVSRQEA